MTYDYFTIGGYSIEVSVDANNSKVFHRRTDATGDVKVITLDELTDLLNKTSLEIFALRRELEHHESRNNRKSITA